MKENGKTYWHDADARVLGQILAAQNIVFALPDAGRIAEFYTQTLRSIPGVRACRVCLNGGSVQAGDMEANCVGGDRCCGFPWEAPGEEITWDGEIDCKLAGRPAVQVIAVRSPEHHWGYFVLEMERQDLFAVYGPFLHNLSNYVALTMENRRQRVSLEKAQQELECKVAERTLDLTVANRDLQREIGERRRTEEALLCSEQRYRRLFEASKDGILLLDGATGRIVDANASVLELLGQTAQQLLGRTADEVGISGSDAATQAAFRVPFSREYARHADVRLCTTGGQFVDVEFVASAYEVDAQRIVQLNVRDVSERRRLEGELRQSQKLEAVGRLAGGVAHDFNNMLSVILGQAELAMEGLDATMPIHASLEEIQKAARRSADLTRQLLAFARKQTVSLKVLDLNQTVAGMLNMLKRLVGEDIDLAWHPDAAVWLVKADPSQIDQILVNLCVNARDAIPNNGRITIETANRTFDEEYCANHLGFVEGDFVGLAISDDGCGMEKETQAHLFEPFFTTKGVGKGTGLGLATVYGIVKQNNGFINVYSEPGRGTTFHIYLPRHSEKARPEVDAAIRPVVRGQETILVVEDEFAILSLTKTMLERLGYTVVVAGSPGEAIRLAGTHKGEIHLLLTDVVMPEMNGRDLASRLSSSFPGLKRLYMSGYTANVIARQGILDKGIHFIQKPFSRADLARKVRAALDGQDAQEVPPGRG